MSNKPAFAATVIVALIAAVAVVIAAQKSSEKARGVTSVTDTAEMSVTRFVPSEEFEDEVYDGVYRLIRDNYTVLRLFYTEGMAHREEPYGNPPEDGYYTADTDEYNSVGEIYAVVDRTFIAEEAARIKETAVYKEKNGVIGINANFEKMPYDINWENPDVEIEFISETLCGLTLTFHSANSEVERKAIMRKESDGAWRLEELVI